MAFEIAGFIVFINCSGISEKGKLRFAECSNPVGNARSFRIRNRQDPKQIGFPEALQLPLIAFDTEHQICSPTVYARCSPTVYVRQTLR